MRYIIVSFFLVAAACPVHAQDTARDHHERAVEAFDNYRWLEAAEEFEASFSLAHRVESLFNIGLAYEKAAQVTRSHRHYRRAITAFTRYIHEVGEDTDLSAVHDRVARLRAELSLLPEESVSYQEEDASPAPVVETPQEENDSAPLLNPYVEGPRRVVNKRFQWVRTVATGAATLALGASAVGVSVRASNRYEELASSCGGTEQGCSDEDTRHVQRLARTATSLWILSGVSLAGTGVAVAFDVRGARAAYTVEF
tara:strand:+ start:3446 stop:4210 length:765 start_codon:yes stop_codon:yes gene_type:complete